VLPTNFEQYCELASSSENTSFYQIFLLINPKAYAYSCSPSPPKKFPAKLVSHFLPLPGLKSILFHVDIKTSWRQQKLSNLFDSATKSFPQTEKVIKVKEEKTKK
jgi:hypothetical protein